MRPSPRAGGNQKVKLSEAWDKAIAWIKAYLKVCRKEDKTPDYNYIRKESKEMVRRLYQR